MEGLMASGETAGSAEAENFIGPLLLLGILALVVVLVVRGRTSPTAPQHQPWNTRSLKIGVVAVAIAGAMGVVNHVVVVEGPEKPFELLVLPLFFFLLWGLIQGVIDGVRGLSFPGARARILAWCGLLLLPLAVLIMVIGTS